eukprot:3121269-Amphidinium_carterae.1
MQSLVPRYGLERITRNMVVSMPTRGIAGSGSLQQKRPRGVPEGDVPNSFKGLPPREVLERWADQRSNPHFDSSGHVAALYSIGRAVRGRSAAEEIEDWHKHDARQRDLQCNPTFGALLSTLHTVIKEEEVPQRRVVRTLSALADTHEDFPFASSSMPPAHRQRVLELRRVALAHALLIVP